MAIASERRSHMGWSRFHSLTTIVILALLFIAPVHALTIVYDDQGNEVCNEPGPSPFCATSLTKLLAGYSIQADDKLFTDWAEISQSISGNATINTALVDVVAFGLGPLEHGIAIQADPLGDGNFSAQDGGSLEYQFGYTVQVIPGSNHLIKDNTLALQNINLFTGTPGVIPTATLSIAEQVFNESMTTLLASKSVVFDLSNIVAVPVIDTADFDPVHSIYVETTISVDSRSSGGLGLSGFSQTYSQVPEPTTLALMGLGLAGIGYQRRRSKKAA